MGLLDDAIREHLELKRKHGADPGEVDRQIEEALGPPQRAEFAEEPGEPGGELRAELAEEPGAEAPEEEAPVAEPVDEDEPFAEERIAAVRAPDPEPEPQPPAESEPFDVESLDDPELSAQPREEGDEDVLEDTPDFLQETPEHDRLWFEQRPPRDFDWDK